MQIFIAEWIIAPNSPKLETSQSPFSGEWISQVWYVYITKHTQPPKELASDTHDPYESQKHHAKWRKPDRKHFILYDSIDLKFLDKGKKPQLQKVAGYFLHIK
jgi:hypothetical protein